MLAGRSEKGVGVDTGVAWRPRRMRYEARVGGGADSVFLNYFGSRVEAAIAVVKHMHELQSQGQERPQGQLKAPEGDPLERVQLDEVPVDGTQGQLRRRLRQQRQQLEQQQVEDHQRQGPQRAQLPKERAVIGGAVLQLGAPPLDVPAITSLPEPASSRLPSPADASRPPVTALDEVCLLPTLDDCPVVSVTASPAGLPASTAPPRCPSNSSAVLPEAAKPSAPVDAGSSGVASVPHCGQSGALPAGWKRVARVSSKGKQYFRFQGLGGLKAQSRPEAWRLSNGTATSPAAAEPNDPVDSGSAAQPDVAMITSQQPPISDGEVVAVDLDRATKGAAQHCKKRGKKPGQPCARWTAEEEERLQEVVAQLGDKCWEMIAERLGSGRSGPGIQQHWRIMCSRSMGGMGQHAASPCGTGHKQTSSKRPRLGSDASSSADQPQHEPTQADALREHHRSFNLHLDPSLAEGASRGVEALRVSAESAASCAAYLETHWHNSALHLPDGRRCYGYAQYGKTLEAHSADEQKETTLLITNAWLPGFRSLVPGFAEMEETLLRWLVDKYGVDVELYFAHALRQGQHTLRSTGFDVHQDTEEFAFIRHTAVVKLTADEVGEPCSAMRVVGAAGGNFEYGQEAGSCGCFDARLYHQSVAPRSKREHLKVAFFFRQMLKSGHERPWLMRVFEEPRLQQHKRGALVVHCGECDACHRTRDCGLCPHCRDKTKCNLPVSNHSHISPS